MKKRSRTAAELKNDSALKERIALREERRLRRVLEAKRLVAPLLASLADQGFVVQEFEDIVSKYAPLPRQAVEIILAALPNMPDDDVQEALVSVLGAAREPFDGRPLKNCYERTYDEGLRWTIINTIALANPHSIDDWLTEMKGTHFDVTLRKLRVPQRKKETGKARGN